MISTSCMNVLERNNVKVIGKGDKTMLFAHGYGCDQNMWRYITPAFENTYRIVLFDHIGFGNSDVSSYVKEDYTSLKDYARDMLEICAELNLENVIFVGHSVSAMIGVLAAIEQPAQFSKLILVSPSPSFINDGDYFGGFTKDAIEELLISLDSDYLGWSNTIAPFIMGNADKPELGQELTQSFCNSNPEVANDFAHITFLSDVRNELHKVKIDTLILQCSEDAIAPVSVGEFVHNQIAGSKFKILDVSGHCPNLSAPTETVEAMKKFLL
jgi:sigma-B regulation protein RsbQ